jgi:hypothetical protein
MKTKVENMVSKSSGNEVANQFVITTPEGRYFQSYDSIIAFVPYNSGKTQLDKRTWDYSMTTSKYRNQFLGETKKETKQKIENGTYILTDLN